MDKTCEFFKLLKANKKSLSVQQYKTIKGQALRGNVADARKGSVLRVAHNACIRVLMRRNIK